VTQTALAELNALDEAGFVALLGGVFEHSPWVASAAWRERPFKSVAALFQAMRDAVGDADGERQLELIRAHPELAGREATRGGLTADSSTEQGRLGFLSLDRGQVERMAELNRRYQQRFGFPCIVALALHASRESVMAEMQRRLGNTPQAELANALEQIAHIARARLQRIVREA
jgi:2-oxo-4-hydroxy-4-carboxy-5-ureidoimidazoline decarboxylase